MSASLHNLCSTQHGHLPCGIAQWLESIPRAQFSIWDLASCCFLPTSIYAPPVLLHSYAHGQSEWSEVHLSLGWGFAMPTACPDEWHVLLYHYALSGRAQVELVLGPFSLVSLRRNGWVVFSMSASQLCGMSMWSQPHLTLRCCDTLGHGQLGQNDLGQRLYKNLSGLGKLILWLWQSRRKCLSMRLKQWSRWLVKKGLTTKVTYGRKMYINQGIRI